MACNLTNFFFLFITFSSALRYSVPFLSPNASVPESTSCSYNSCVVSDLLCWIDLFIYLLGISQEAGKIGVNLLCSASCYFILCRSRSGKVKGMGVLGVSYSFYLVRGSR